MTGDNHEPDPFTNLYEAPAKLARAMFAPMAGAVDANALKPEDMQHWAQVGTKLQGMWLEYQAEQLRDPKAMMPYLDPTRWMALAEGWYRQMPLANVEGRRRCGKKGLRCGPGFSASSASVPMRRLVRRTARKNPTNYRARTAALPMSVGAAIRPSP